MRAGAGLLFAFLVVLSLASPAAQAADNWVSLGTREGDPVWRTRNNPLIWSSAVPQMRNPQT